MCNMKIIDLFILNQSPCLFLVATHTKSKVTTELGYIHTNASSYPGGMLGTCGYLFSHAIYVAEQ